MKRSACVLVLLIVASAVGAQEAAPPKRTIHFDGMEVFCHVLHHARLRPITDPESELNPETTVVILFGNLRRVRLGERGVQPRSLGRRLSQFQQRGGNVLVASDYPDHGALRPWGVRIAGTTIFAPPVRELSYRGLPECPLIRQGLAPHHPLLLGLTRGLATNCPTSLGIQGDSPLTALASLPVPKTDLGGALRNFGLGEELQAGARLIDRASEPIYLAAHAADAKPTGRVAVIAGHQLFMNGMMLQPDNDNFAFAVNTVRWLREGPGGRSRRQALFVVDGQVVTEFDVKLTPPPPPIPLPPAEFIDRLPDPINRLLLGLERERFFSRLLESEPRVLRRLVQLALLLGTFAFVLYGAKKLIAARRRQDLEVPLLVGPYAATPAQRGNIVDRHDEAIRRNQLGSAAQALARAWLRDHAPAGDGPVDVAASGSVWQRWRLRRQAGRVLALARGTPPARVTVAQLVTLSHALAALSRAVQDGRLALRRCSLTTNS